MTILPTRHRRLAVTSLLASLAIAATACGDDPDDLAVAARAPTAATDTVAADTASPGATNAPDASCTTGCSTSIFLHVTNNSSHDLLYVGDEGNSPGTTDPSPALRIPAHGGTDSIEFKTSDSHGAEYQPMWRVDGSEDLVHSFFQVPIIGFNQTGCDGNNMRPQSQSVKSSCSIDHGYHPNASLTVTDR